MASSVESRGENLSENQLIREHREPEQPLVYEPPDLYGRKHVEKITGEYRVREDGCLAELLQNQEFELHFGKNKIDNRIRHMDLSTAKAIYIREVEESGMLSKDEISNLCKDDAFLALEVEKRLNENMQMEAQSKSASEMQDEEFAKYLQAKEKQKLDMQRKQRLELRVQQDREAARRLQRELDVQAENEGYLQQGMEEIEISPRQDWGLECEVGSAHGKNIKEELNIIKVDQTTDEEHLKEMEMEQRRLEEERDRKIAIKLQRAEADEYHRAKKEKQLRRAKSERQRHDDVDLERRGHMQAVDANGNPIRSTTPPERRRTQQSADSPRSQQPVDGNAIRSTTPPERRRRLQSVDSSGRPIRMDAPRKQHSGDEAGRKSSRDTPRKHRPVDESSRPIRIDSSRRHQSVDETGRSIRTNNSPIKPPPVDYNDKIIHVDSPSRNAHACKKVDSAGRPVHSTSNSNSKAAASTPHRNQHNAKRPSPPHPPKENIYLTAVDSIGAVNAARNNEVILHDTNSPDNTPIHNSVGRTDSWGIEIQRSGPVSTTNADGQYKNIAAEIDPTYSTIKHFQPEHRKESDMIRSAPVVQNIKRNTRDDSNKKKKKWFSKKEKSSS